MKVENIIKTLIEKKNYDKVQTERLAPKIEALPEEIKEALNTWVESDKISEVEYNGYTVEKEKPSMTTLAAFLMLDWIRKDPKNALKALKQVVIKRI